MYREKLYDITFDYLGSDVSLILTLIGGSNMSKRILIVDDSPTEIQVMKESVSQGGYEIITASNGDEAIKKCIELQPDLVLLDVVMPIKDGFSVCRELKKNPQTKDIKIIIVTSKNKPLDKQWSMKQGADSYFSKPFEPTELSDAVAQLI